MNSFKKINATLFYRIVFSVITFFGLITLSSCKKDLDLQPVSGQLPAVVFSTVSTTQQAIMGVYQQLEGDQGYGIRLSLYYTVDNDETMGPSGDDNDRRGLAHYHLLSTNAQLEAPYDQLYAGIERANQCIYYIPQSAKYNDGNPSDSIQMHKMYGEALTLRAQFYFELIRNWGDVPAQFLPSALEPNVFLPKMDRDSIYDHLLNDLAIAEQYVPWLGDPNGTNDGRLTQGAVRGLRARIALYRAGYSLRRNPVQMLQGTNPLTYYAIAKNECSVIWNSGRHRLNPSYKSVFQDYICPGQVDNQFGEVMFTVGMGGAGGSDQGVNSSKLGYYNGPKYSGAGNASLFILPTYFYTFDSMDRRRDVTIAPYDINADYSKTCQKITALRDGKFRRDWTPLGGGASLQYFNESWPILRFSDVLLMFAEADNALNNGPDDSAYLAIDAVRERGFSVDLSTPNTSADLTPGLDQSDFFDSLVLERSLELGAEGIRKYDLIRWNLLGTTLTQTRSLLTALGSGTPPAPYNTYPTSMYYYSADGQNNPASPNQIDDGRLWATSFYGPNEVPPSGNGPTTKVSWIGSGILSTFITTSGTYLGFAGYFTPNHNELYPLPQHTVDAGHLTQDYGY